MSEDGPDLGARLGVRPRIRHGVMLATRASRVTPPGLGAGGKELKEVAEDRGFEPLRAVNPTRFPSERHRPLGESSAAGEYL